MTENPVVLAVALALSPLTPLGAQFEIPPTIDVQDATRSIGIEGDADGTFNSAADQTLAAGPFSSNLLDLVFGAQGSQVSMDAHQKSSISTFSVRGTAGAGASAEATAMGSAAVNSTSTLSISFSVPVDAPYLLTGMLDSGVEGLGQVGMASVSMQHLDAGGQLVLHQESSQSFGTSTGEVPFAFAGTVEAGSAAFFTITTSTSVNGFGDDAVSAFAAAEFDLDFGDRDGDGLMDLWEEQGIDFPGPGIEIDLPSMGADPDVKDLFVEVDVMDQVEWDQSAIDDVVFAFAQAPAELVDNNDGSAGIQLHVVTDGDRPPHLQLVEQNSRLPNQFYIIKASWFGSDDDRLHDDWAVPNGIRDTKMLIFRYCLWADTYVESNLEDHILGKAEGFPGNDFIIAAGRHREKYPNLFRAELSATFMHELGHTLGLRHGGQDDDDYKPNYLSIMNYAYAFPSEKITAHGTNSAIFWRLDYSRSEMAFLDETNLHEDDPLDGPAGRVVIFNSANESDPMPVVRTFAWAHRPGIDWNANGGDPKIDPYQLDINRDSEDTAVDYDSSLVSYTDWDWLWYHPHGTPDFDDRAPPPFASPSPALREEDLIAFHDVEWIDLTADGDEIFSNGFELGSSTAWSDTQPK